MTSRALFDPGLQLERTALAWRRTSLALAVGSGVCFRLLLPLLGPWSIVAALAGLMLTAATWILADRRAHQMRNVLLGTTGRLPGGGLTLFVAIVVTCLGAGGVLWLALTGLRQVGVGW